VVGISYKSADEKNECGGIQFDGSMIVRPPMLPALRSLDFMPSHVLERPGLLIRDPYRFSDVTLIVPPALTGGLQFFDGCHSDLDLREYLVRTTGNLEVGDLVRHFVDALSEAGFLEDENFARRKQEAEQRFAAALRRDPVHAGSGYPAEAAELRQTLAGYMDGAAAGIGRGSATAIAAPHVSPFGGVETYRAAYSALSPGDAERTFVILGTSHYGRPDCFGLTRKPFATPFGETATDLGVVDFLEKEARDGAVMEDYCHAVEHSIEFQVIFLQHLFGPRIRIVPILCGAYVRSLYEGGLPEASEPVRRAIGTLGELASRENGRLLWVLGVDMAHIGRRYGDQLQARAGQGEMEQVERRDRSRIACMEQGDAQGFWEQVRENRDDLKWCGAAPIYTFLRAVPQARGRLLRYQQWNIDEGSVVSFAGMAFWS
jgi:AmmeMemoRadiSam system protein B